ncbi:hypothetical protein [Caldimonas sp. KR1-144]|uniref:hypothetical protein n=1 Tax=Caldimonas sp. KR1-144 TaxID=3400911 RepID=UPI003BFB494C
MQAADSQPRRADDGARPPPDEMPSYQELLDEAIEETFPASDPIAVSGATHADRAHPTPRDAIDWTLQPEHDPKVRRQP